MKTVFEYERERSSNSFSTYVIDFVIMLIIGLGVLVYNIKNSLANFEYVLGTVDIIYILVIPIITMKSISEDRKQHTDNLLYSLPLSMTDIVCGKYMALVSRLFMPLVIAAFYPLIFRIYGDIYLPTSYGTLIAFFLLGACFLAVGLFISSLTDNQGLAAGITAILIALDYFIVSLSEYVPDSAGGSLFVLEIILVLLCLVLLFMTKNKSIALLFGIVCEIVIALMFMFSRTSFEGLIPNIMKNISLYERFYAFVNGVFDITAIIYYLSVIAFFLFLTVQSMEKRRYN